jgi:2-aminoadipate transaminase
MRTRGVTCSADDIFITNGNQQGLELCARLLLDGHETVAVEEFTFTGILQAAQGHGAVPISIPVNRETGLDLAAFERQLRRVRPRLAMLIPDFHNPLGISLDCAKRLRLAELAARYGVPLVEDSPYSLLRFQGELLPPIKAFDEADSVIYLGSFSKMISPALRLGWMVAPRALLPRLTVLREALDLESSQLTQRVVAEFLARGHLVPHLAQLNTANRARRDRMLSALAAELGDVAEWTVPEGGLFVWLSLPTLVDTQELLNDALMRHVAFVPGFAFAAEPGPDGRRGANCMRLNFSNAPPERLAEGIHCLADAIRQHLAVRRGARLNHEA